MQDFNYHTHTRRCHHADNSMSDEDFVIEHIKEGFKKMSFSDHAPEKEIIDTRKNMRMTYEERKEYLDSIKELRDKYKNIIDIESGYEVEYLPGQEDNLMELKSEVDNILLGQHFIFNSDKNIDRRLKIFRYQEFSDEDLITYANYIKRACEIGLPDIIVHPDLFMLSRNSFGDNEEKVSRIICESAQKYKIPLEINLTEPHIYLLNRIKRISYPCKEFWKIASEYDIEVLYGLDAHYRHQITGYKESKLLADEIIGEDTIKKLNFIKKC